MEFKGHKPVASSIEVKSNVIGWNELGIKENQPGLYKLGLEVLLCIHENWLESQLQIYYMESPSTYINSASNGNTGHTV